MVSFYIVVIQQQSQEFDISTMCVCSSMSFSHIWEKWLVLTFYLTSLYVPLPSPIYINNLISLMINYDVSWHNLSILFGVQSYSHKLHVYVCCQIWEIFSHYFFFLTDTILIYVCTHTYIYCKANANITNFSKENISFNCSKNIQHELYTQQIFKYTYIVLTTG